MEVVEKCPICSGEKHSLFLKCEDFTVSREFFSIMTCDRCGFKFTSPRPEAQEIGRYYKSEEYVSHTDTKKGLINKLYHWVRNYTLVKKLQLISQYRSQGIILDYGCGTGAFLETCKAAKWTVFGIEPDSGARTIAKQKCGKEIHQGSKDLEETHPNLKMDVITLWHVLEHIHDLEDWFGFISRHMAESSTLIVAVPNCSSWDAKKFKEYWAAFDVPRHLWHFTPKDIEALFANHGYKLIRILPMVFDSYYVSMLSQKHRTGDSHLISSMWGGLASNFKAMKTGKEYSSQIYVLKKIS